MSQSRPSMWQRWLLRSYVDFWRIGHAFGQLYRLRSHRRAKFHGCVLHKTNQRIPHSPSLQTATSAGKCAPTFGIVSIPGAPMIAALPGSFACVGSCCCCGCCRDCCSRCHYRCRYCYRCCCCRHTGTSECLRFVGAFVSETTVGATTHNTPHPSFATHNNRRRGGSKVVKYLPSTRPFLEATIRYVAFHVHKTTIAATIASAPQPVATYLHRRNCRQHTEPPPGTTSVVVAGSNRAICSR